MKGKMQGLRLILGIVVLASGPALAGNAKPQPQGQAQTQKNLCPFVKTTEITVLPRTAQVQIDASKTLAQMQNQKMDTINPYGFSGMSSTQAYMGATVGIGKDADIDIDYNFDKRLGAYCMWYNRIYIPIDISPTIYIAKELHADPCLRKVTIEHEMKHVDVDRRMVNKYAKIIGQKIYNGLKERGFRAQPVPPEGGQHMMNRMSELITQIVEMEHNKMQIERLEAQREVDNLQEYERVSALCPKERARIEAIQMKALGMKTKNQR
jgi:hypothetical protein